MAWVAVNRFNHEYIYEEKPKRYYCCFWALDSLLGSVIELPKGSIKKLIGRALSWKHEPVELPSSIKSKENNNMETKEIKIKVPEGYEIDKENSTFECIKLKPIKKVLTYKDVAGELFDSTGFFINSRGEVLSTEGIDALDEKADKNNATNKKQLERLMALNQLLNIAEYYNKKSPKEENYIYRINFEKSSSEYFVQEDICPTIVCGLIPTFNNHADAKAVIDNQNFKDILDLIYKGDED